jgi:glucokinase
MILAGDIGGTKCALALVHEENLRSPAAEQTFRSRDYGGLEDVVRGFLSTAGAGGQRIQSYAKPALDDYNPGTPSYARHECRQIDQ